MPSPARPARTLALGVWLARQGPLAISGFVLAAVGAAIGAAAPTLLQREGGRDIARVPMLASELVAWSAGIMISYGAGLRAFHGDREQGIVALVQVRSAGLGAYVRGRVAGLILVLEAAVGGAALIAGIAALATGGVTTLVVRASAAALAYAMAFAAVIGPIAMASLTVRTRAGGYMALVAVLVIPELVSPWTLTLLPGDWRELTSIPAALGAISQYIAAPISSGPRAARALAFLAAVFAVSVLVIGTRAGRAAAQRLR